MNLEFDPCFDQKKIIRLSSVLPQTYAELNKMAPWRKGKWPTKVHCMTDSKIVEGRKRGAGHGFTFVGGGRSNNSVWMNCYMSVVGHWLVLTHESLHHSHPDASEQELNCILVPHIYKQVFGKKLTPEYGRRHGLGSPVPGVGDRSYCR